jgi:RNA polymerase subunit RPABC4/transcription elongation factor Spt4
MQNSAMSSAEFTCRKCGYVMEQMLPACPACGNVNETDEGVAQASQFSSSTADPEKSKIANIRLFKKCKLLSLIFACLALSGLWPMYIAPVLRGADEYGYYILPRTIRASELKMSLAEMHACVTVILLISVALFGVFLYFWHIQARKENEFYAGG